MGETWLAEEPADGHLIVMKQIVASESERFAIRERFAEHRVHAPALNAAGVITFTHLFEDAERIWLVRDYIDAEPLAMTIVDHSLTPHGIHSILREIAAALETLQKFGLYHGHLWLTNIFVLADGSVGLTDAGLIPSVDVLERVKPGHLISCSPERLKGAETSIQDDCYAIGALFQMLVSSHPPYHDLTESALRIAILENGLPTPKELQIPSRQPEALLLESLIAPNLRDRICKPREIRASFDALGDLVRMPERPGEPKSPSPRQLIWLSVIMLVLIVCWLLYFFD